MAKGLSLHIGLGIVDSNVHGTNLPAPGCDDAAEAMKEIAEDSGFVESIVLTNENATIENVTANLNALAARLEPGDLLLVTLAGHCAPREDGGDCEEGRNQMFLLFNKRWIDDDIYAALKAINMPVRIMIVANACHSGSIFTVRLEAGKEILERYPPRDAAPIDSRGLDFLLFGRLEAERLFGCRDPITANVLLLASSEERTTSSSHGPNDLPQFTQALLTVLPTSTSYDDLRAKMDAQLPPEARPVVLNRRLMRDAAFANQVPFTI